MISGGNISFLEQMNELNEELNTIFIEDLEYYLHADTCNKEESVAIPSKRVAKELTYRCVLIKTVSDLCSNLNKCCNFSERAYCLYRNVII